MTLSTAPSLSAQDPELALLLRQEEARQSRSLSLIASENYVSAAVMEATGSCLTNKYSEGYAHKRYYEGQGVIDQVEELAIARLKLLFGAEHVNVQPYSGSPANLAVYLAFCQPGDPILGLALSAGGHLTHGHDVSITGRYFTSIPYGVRKGDCRIDLDQVRDLARKHRPKILWCGTTAYPRVLDFAAFREIADEVGAKLIADIAHISGLVCSGVHPSPVGIADVITSTTHKTFRGPRGGMIFCKKEYAAQIDRAIFPGLQGGPHNQTTAGIAVAAGEALTPAFKQYAQAVVDNAAACSAALMERGFDVVTGGTDNHLLVVDLTRKGVSGKQAAQALARAGLVLNYNTVPFDPRKPFDPSGIRLGTAGITTRGVDPTVVTQIAQWIDQVVTAPTDETKLQQIAGEVAEVCKLYPAPGLCV